MLCKKSKRCTIFPAIVVVLSLYFIIKTSLNLLLKVDPQTYKFANNTLILRTNKYCGNSHAL